MYKPTIRSPRSIAEEKNGAEGFQGDAGYNPVAGAPNGVADIAADRGESRYRSNPTNPSEPPAEWAQKHS